MKSRRPNDTRNIGHVMGPIPRHPLTAEERAQQRLHDKEFIKAMNEFTEKAGVLSDDPYFGGI